MYNKDEEKLDAMKKEYRSIDIPENIDDYIGRGIQKGKKEKRKKRMTRLISYAASFLLVVMLISIRVSPAFAEIMSNIPGVEYIVKLINYDKGLQLAVENNFLQHVGVSDEHEGIVFTVEDIIVDESQMIVFYSIENKSDYENIILSSIFFLDEKGNSLQASYGWSSNSDKNLVDGKQLGKVSVSFGPETIIPDKMTVKVKLSSRISTDKMNNAYRVGETVQKQSEIKFDSDWNVKVAIDKDKFENLKETYLVNKEVIFDNQKVLFKQVTLHPTRVVLDIEYDENNTKKIFGFENLRLIDENTEWATISNGITASYPDEKSAILYLESNYFTKPESIYIAVDGIRALDKDKLEIKIDLKKGEMLNSPDDKLRLIEVSSSKGIGNDENLIDIVFDLKPLDSGEFIELFNYKFKDDAGIEYSSKGVGQHETEDETHRTHYSIDANESYSNPITLTISDYPNMIKKDIKIKVK